MQYSTKLKKNTVQVLKTERTGNTSRNNGADVVNHGEEEGGNDTGSGLVVKEKRMRDRSAPVTEVMRDATESGTSEKSPDDDHDDDDEQQEAAAADEQHSDYDPYKCDIDEDDDDDEEEDEDVENDETFTPAKQRRQQTNAKRKRGRPLKAPPSGGAGTDSSHSNSARKSSRLKLVRKAIAKVKRDKNTNSSSGNSNSKPFEKPKCSKCDYVAPSVDKLEQHVKRAHKDDTVYACGVCGYTCAWNREYYRHMKRHFRGPPYECDFEACDYVSDRIQPLLYHRMVSFLLMRVAGLSHWFTLLMGVEYVQKVRSQKAVSFASLWSIHTVCLRDTGSRTGKMGCVIYRMFHITQGPGPHCFLLCWSQFHYWFQSRSNPV